MSETLSYQPEVQTESAPDNLTPEEQDSLAVGEKLQEQQEGLLAGKYKSAEGKEVRLPFKGPLEPTVQSLLGGIRSACTYVGAQKIKELSKCSTFILVNNTHNRVYE